MCLVIDTLAALRASKTWEWGRAAAVLRQALANRTACRRSCAILRHWSPDDLEDIGLAFHELRCSSRGGLVVSVPRTFR